MTDDAPNDPEPQSAPATGSETSEAQLIELLGAIKAILQELAERNTSAVNQTRTSGLQLIDATGRLETAMGQWERRIHASTERLEDAGRRFQGRFLEQFREVVRQHGAEMGTAYGQAAGQEVRAAAAAVYRATDAVSFGRLACVGAACGIALPLLVALGVWMAVPGGHGLTFSQRYAALQRIGPCAVEDQPRVCAQLSGKPRILSGPSGATFVVLDAD